MPERIKYADVIKAKRIDFYQRFNYDYFARKATYLVALLAKKDQLSAILSDMPQYGSLHIGVEPKDVDTKKYVHDLELEIHMTLFLALETLFRVWFAVMLESGYEHIFLKQFSSERFADYFHRFFIKKEYKSVLPAFTSMEDIIRQTFFLGIDLEKTFGKEEADKRVANVLSFVDRLVKRFDERSIYNAYKHSSLDFKHATYEPGGISFNGFSFIDKRSNGMSTFQYPTDEQVASGNFEIKEEVTLMSPDCSAAEAIIVTHLLQNLIESRKYLLNLTSKEDFQKAILPFDRGADVLDQTGVHTQTFSMIERFTKNPPVV